MNNNPYNQDFNFESLDEQRDSMMHQPYSGYEYGINTVDQRQKPPGMMPGGPGGGPGQGGPGYPGNPGGANFGGPGPGLPSPPKQPPPPQGGPPGGPPSASPPQFVPDFPGLSVFAVDAGALQGCLFRNTYVWLNNGRGFWFYPVFIGRTSVAGFRWRASQRRWIYYGLDTSNIRSFQCY